MVLYEVNIQLPSALRQEYLAWLTSHIQDMLALPVFLKADLWEVASEEAETQLVVHYQLENREAFTQYLEQYAPALRQTGLQQFGSQCQITRRLLLSEAP